MWTGRPVRVERTRRCGRDFWVVKRSGGWEGLDMATDVCRCQRNSRKSDRCHNPNANVQTEISSKGKVSR